MNETSETNTDVVSEVNTDVVSETNTDVKQKKKVKLFNKIYTDMQNSINSSLKKKYKVHTVSSSKVLKNFEKNVDSNMELYTKCDETLFQKCTLLDKVFTGKPQLSKKNKEVVWKYIQTLYSLVKEENKQVVLAKPNGLPEGLDNMMSSLMNNVAIKSIVDDISSQLQQATAGKDIDEQGIMKDLLAGNFQSSGIDFKKIIQNTSKNLEKKIQDGEIDREEVAKTAESLKKTLDLN